MVSVRRVLSVDFRVINNLNSFNTLNNVDNVNNVESVDNVEKLLITRILIERMFY